MSYNPFKRARVVAKLVNKGDSRRCHKIRCADYYGGISTVDVLGCNLSCVYCWVGENKKDMKNWNTWGYYSPQRTSEILINQALKNDLKKVRLSGGEPLINKKHTLKVIDRTTNEGFGYILETNGTLVNKDFIKSLLKYKDYIYVYFGLKGINPKKLSEICNATPDTFYIQLKALKMFIDNGFTIGVNLISNFCKKDELDSLIATIQKKVNVVAPICIDLKRATLFPHIIHRIKREKVPTFKPKNVILEWDNLLQSHYGNKTQFLLSEYCLKENSDVIKKYKTAISKVLWFEKMKFLPFEDVFRTLDRQGLAIPRTYLF